MVKKDKPITLPKYNPPPDYLWEQKISDAVSKAMQSFYPRMSTLDGYSKQLIEIDKQVITLVNRTVMQTAVSYWTSYFLYIIGYIVAICLIGFGVYYSTRLQQDIESLGIICIISGILALMVIVSRNPLKNMRYLMSNMIKISIIFSGYVRQIHQVDLVFKNLFVDTADIVPEKLDELFKYLQDAVEEAMVSISQALNDVES